MVHCKKLASTCRRRVTEAEGGDFALVTMEHAAAAHDLNLSRQAITLVDRCEILRRGDGGSVDGENDISGSQPELPCDAAGGHFVHLDTAAGARTESPTDLLGLRGRQRRADGWVSARRYRSHDGPRPLNSTRVVCGELTFLCGGTTRRIPREAGPPRLHDRGTTPSGARGFAAQGVAASRAATPGPPPVDQLRKAHSQPGACATVCHIRPLRRGLLPARLRLTRVGRGRQAGLQPGKSHDEGERSYHHRGEPLPYWSARRRRG